MRNTIEVQFADDLVGIFPIAAAQTEVSERSGRPLKRLTATTRNSDRELHNDFLARLESVPADGFAAMDPETGEPKHWTIALSSWSESNQNYSYTLDLVEKENLTLTTLVIDGVDFAPVRYEERASGSIVSIDVQVVADAAARERLNALIDMGGYFPVVRRGINESALEMRFGLCMWSEHGDTWKFLLTLVDKRRDDRDGPTGSYAAFMANQRESLVFRAAYVDEITALMVKKGLVSEDEITAARDRARDGLAERFRRLTQVSDVDELSI